MFDQSFRCLFMGENSTWLKISQALAQAPCISLTVQRATTFAEASLALSAGPWDALALDLHAWSFQALRYIQKFRSDYPALAVLALSYPSVLELDAKARSAGASLCLSLENLSAEALYTAILSLISEEETQPHLRNDSPMDLALFYRKDSALPPTRAEIVSHAVNNLLCVINANADVLAERFAESDPALRSVDEIKKAAKSAADLIRNLK